MSARNLLKIGWVANLFERYEFVVYIYLADIISQLFFQAADSFQYFDRETVLAWAWRLPFLLSIPLTIGIGIMRCAIIEFPLPQEGREERWRSAQTLHRLKQPFLKPLFTAVPIIAFVSVFGYLLLIWMPSYLTHLLHYSLPLVQLTNMFVLASLTVFNLAAGYIARFIDYRKLIQLGIGCVCILIYPLFTALQEARYRIVLAVLSILALLHGGINGVIMQMLAEAFPRSLRCRGMNLAYTLPMGFCGGTAPLVCTWLTAKTGVLLFPTFYITCFGFIGFLVAFRLAPPHVAEFETPAIEVRGALPPGA